MYKWKDFVSSYTYFLHWKNYRDGLSFEGRTMIRNNPLKINNSCDILHVPSTSSERPNLIIVFLAKDIPRASTSLLTSRTASAVRLKNNMMTTLSTLMSSLEVKQWRWWWGSEEAKGHSWKILRWFSPMFGAVIQSVICMMLFQEFATKAGLKVEWKCVYSQSSLMGLRLMRLIRMDVQKDLCYDNYSRVKTSHLT